MSSSPKRPTLERSSGTRGAWNMQSVSWGTSAVWLEQSRRHLEILSQANFDRNVAYCPFSAERAGIHRGVEEGSDHTLTRLLSCHPQI